MPDTLYVYGIVKFGFDLDWKEHGLNGKNVYTINEGKFSALVHDSEEKPYTSEDPNKIKELLIAHNKILDRAIQDFGGVIPLHFNTIIKKGESSAEYNLKKWLNDDKERLEKVWNKVNGKREYGIRIYYEKDKLIQEAKNSPEVKKTEKALKGKSQGVGYLLQEKVKSKIGEIVQNRINQLKQEFHGHIKKITEKIVVNDSRIAIDEEKDLLVNLSVLADNQQIDKIRRVFGKKEGKDLSFQFAGPFAPYSFVENGTK